MQNKITLINLTLAGLLVLTAGCGKTESPATSAKESRPPASAAQAQPTPMTEKPMAQLTNVMAAATSTAQTTLDTVVKAADTGAAAMKEAAPKAPDTAVAPVQEPAPKAADTAVTPAKDAAIPAAVPTQVQAQSALAALSQDQVVQGLKDALGKGLQQAIARLGHDGGFLTNASVKIPMPATLQKVENALRAVKQEKLADDFVTTMNHAAEQAVPEAGTVFADALKQMTIEDAKSILSGTNNAATQYFQKTTQTNLYAKFYPIVQKATQTAGVTAAYKKLMEKANVSQGLGGLGSTLSSTLLGKESLDIDAYVTNKAMEGLFKMVAEEEQQIRQNPVARTTELLQQVFGALKK